MTLPQLIERLERLAAPPSSQAAAARKLGVSPAYLCDVLKGRREPGTKILAALDYEKVVTYRRRNSGQ